MRKVYRTVFLSAMVTLINCHRLDILKHRNVLLCYYWMVNCKTKEPAVLMSTETASHAHRNYASIVVFSGHL